MGKNGQMGAKSLQRLSVKNAYTQRILTSTVHYRLVRHRRGEMSTSFVDYPVHRSGISGGLIPV